MSREFVWTAALGSFGGSMLGQRGEREFVCGAAMEASSCGALLSRLGGRSRPLFLRAAVFALAALPALLAAPAQAQSITATPAVPGDPHAVAVNTVTNKIYLANLDGTLTVVDGVTNAVSNISYGGSQNWAVAVNPVTNFVFVADRGSSQIDVFTGAVGSTPAQFLESVPTGQR